jgi:hypothetical protein
MVPSTTQSLNHQYLGAAAAPAQVYPSPASSSGYMATPSGPFRAISSLIPNATPGSVLLTSASVSLGSSLLNPLNGELNVKQKSLSSKFSKAEVQQDVKLNADESHSSSNSSKPVSSSIKRSMHTTSNPLSNKVGKLYQNSSPNASRTISRFEGASASATESIDTERALGQLLDFSSAEEYSDASSSSSSSATAAAPASAGVGNNDHFVGFSRLNVSLLTKMRQERAKASTAQEVTTAATAQASTKVQFVPSKVNMYIDIDFEVVEKSEYYKFNLLGKNCFVKRLDSGVYMFTGD